MLKDKNFRVSLLLFGGVSGVFITILFCINSLSGGLGVLFALLLLLVFFFSARVRMGSIAQLNQYLRRIQNTAQTFDIRSNEEGELSILKSEIYKVSTRLLEQTNQLEKEKLALKEVLADITHQLKTPLTSISIMADLLEDENLPLAKRKEFLGSLRISLEKTQWLVLSFLKMAKLDTNSLVLKQEKINLQDVVLQAVQNTDALRQQKQVAVLFEADAPIFVHCDFAWSVEAVSNVVKNAIEHTPAGKQVTIGVRQTPLFSCVTVQDAGTGVAPQDLPHIFKRFYKNESASAENMGIGLAMSLAIMQRQGGSIILHNEQNGGAIFSLKFYGNTAQGLPYNRAQAPCDKTVTEVVTLL